MCCVQPGVSNDIRREELKSGDVPCSSFAINTPASSKDTSARVCHWEQLLRRRYNRLRISVVKQSKAIGKKFKEVRNEKEMDIHQLVGQLH